MNYCVSNSIGNYYVCADSIDRRITQWPLEIAKAKSAPILELKAAKKEKYDVAFEIAKAKSASILEVKAAKIEKR